MFLYPLKFAAKRSFFSLFFTFICMLPLYGTSQKTIGLPEIVNYQKDQYNAGTQNWEVDQDSNGFLYYANNEGLLSFDGTFWKLYPLPNKTIVRSLEIGKDKRIYVGGQDEIGYFSPDKTGRLAYTSLLQQLPETERTFADVWQITVYDNDVFFRTGKKILKLSNNKISIYPTENGWNYLGVCNNQLLAQNSKEGLLLFDKSQWKIAIPFSDLPTGFLVTSAVPFDKSSILLVTTQHGLFLLQNNHLSPFKLVGQDINLEEHFSSASPIDSVTFALGTFNSGCYIINKAGAVVQHFSRKSGLQNNNVRSLLIDKSKNIWLGLDRGIDFIAFDNAVKHISPANLNDGAGYASLVHDEEFYAALSNGIYHVPLETLSDIAGTKNEFKLLPNTEGQGYSLSLIKGNLIAGKHEGVFQIKNGVATPIIRGTGFWTFQTLFNNDNASSLVAGNYQGLRLLNLKDNLFTPGAVIPGFSESARFVTIDDHNNIWTSHPYRGIYKTHLVKDNNSTVKLYTAANGLPSTLNNHVYKIRGKILVATVKGIYEYNKQTDKFQPDVFYKGIFGETGIRYLKDDAKGNIWFIRDKNLGIADFSTKTPSIIYFPELKGKMVSGFEHVYPFNEKNVFIGAEKGFYHINYEKYKHNKHTLTVFVRSVEALGKTDSLLFGGFSTKETIAKQETPRVGYQSNSFHIEYSSPLYEQQSNIEYSYYLEGFDKGWSEWSKKTDKDYTYLPAGSYTFSVKARNNLGNESAPAKYSFIVLPPWYQTVWAYMAYTLLAIAAGYFLFIRHKKQLLLQQQKHEEEQKRLQYLHQLELDKSEKEIVKLRNEKLETEIEFKNSELASTAMNLVQKGELLTKIKDDLKRLNKHLKDSEDLDDVKKIIHVLTVEEKMSADWDQFAIHFNKVHSDFLLVLKEKHPYLNANDLKLCAYLRMNLTSKEIAQLLNISVRGVEISRYRLRKKLQLPTEVNLFQFLLGIQTHKTAW